MISSYLDKERIDYIKEKLRLVSTTGKVQHKTLPDASIAFSDLGFLSSFIKR